MQIVCKDGPFNGERFDQLGNCVTNPRLCGRLFLNTSTITFCCRTIARSPTYQVYILEEDTPDIWTVTFLRTEWTI